MLWILCGMTAPAAQLLSGHHPKWLILTGVAVAGILCLMLVLFQESFNEKWFAFLQGVWLLIVLGQCAAQCGQSWPMGQGRWIVPAVLLALGAWSVQHGPAAAARIAGILFILICIGYSVILGAGAFQVQGDWVGGHSAISLEKAVFWFLMPAAAFCLPRRQEKRHGLLIFLVPLFCTAAAIVTCGNVNPFGEQVNYTFFEMCRSLSLFGLAERFEALVCALVTVGWFALLSFLLSCFGACVQNLCPGKGGTGAWIAAAVALAWVLSKMHMPLFALGAGAVIFWGFLPTITQGIAIVKNGGKK